MSWQFWLLPLALFWFFGFGRRWRDRAEEGWTRGRKRGRLKPGEREVEMLNELDAQRNYMADLEARVAELENRLDFTERLLSSRQEPAAAQ